MFRSKTVFVVGAGASREAGLPIGDELKYKIAEKLNFEYEMGYRLTSGDAVIADALKRYAAERDNGSDPKLYFQECRHLASAMPQSISINSYLDAHEGNRKLELCGKLAIVRSILEAETKSKLKIDETKVDRLERFSALDLKGTWYQSLFMLLTENVRADALSTLFENVSFVIFNYDRCVEHYLYHSVQNYYHVSEQEAAHLLESLKITHPYGAVGKLPWQINPGGVSFGANQMDRGLLETQPR